jgi:hypothetical protein
MYNNDYIMIGSAIGALLCLVLYLQRRRARKIRDMRGN